VGEYVNPPFFLLLLAGCYPFLKKIGPQLKAVFVLWIGVPYVILILMPAGKYARYLIPLLPALSLISSFALREISGRAFGKALLLTTVIFGVFQYYDFRYDIAGFVNSGYKGLHYFRCGGELDISSSSLEQQSKTIKSMGDIVFDAIGGPSKPGSRPIKYLFICG